MIAGSRESQLAMAQTEEFRERLEKITGEKCEIKGITSSGDKDTETALTAMGGTGVFVKELEEALLRGEIDCAVSSLKDIPINMDPRFTVAAILPRGDVRDALVPASLQDLQCGAIIGTSSARREMLLRATKPSLRVKSIRGNMNTRLDKLNNGEYTAVILAKAGLDRLGIDRNVHPIDKHVFVPAAGQGAIAVECRKDDAKTIELLKKIDDAKTRAEVEFEGKILELMGAGCSSPVGINAELDGDTMKLIAVSFIDIVPVRISAEFPASEAMSHAQEIADRLMKRA